VVAVSPFGIVPLHRDGEDSRHVTPVDNLTASLRYLALRQRSDVPYTPVKTREERQLFGRLILRAIQQKQSMTAKSTFESLVEMWDSCALGSNNIYKKYPEHLMRYYKVWKKNKTRQESINSSKANLVMNAVEHVPTLLRTHKLKVPQSLACPTSLSVASPGLESLPTSMSLHSLVPTARTHSRGSIVLPSQHPHALLPSIPVRNHPPFSDHPFYAAPDHASRHISMPYSGIMSSTPPVIRTRRMRQCKQSGCPNPKSCEGKWSKKKCPQINFMNGTDL
jgi:hypothetical protein